MNVRLKLFASYRRHLPYLTKKGSEAAPPDSQSSACDLDVPAGTRAVDLLARLDVPTHDGASVILVNGRTAAPERVLEEGDVIAAFPAMAGG